MATPILSEPIVHDALASLGLPGAIIFVLLFVIGVLAAGNVLQWKHSNKVYGYRLQERDVLRDALNDSKRTLQEMLQGMKERNEITEELMSVVRDHTSDYKSLKDKIEYHYETMKADKTRAEQIINVMSEAIRNLTATVASMHTDMMVATAQVRATLDNIRQPQRRGG